LKTLDLIAQLPEFELAEWFHLHVQHNRDSLSWIMKIWKKKTWN
jgi:hypothetical protein